MISAYTKAGAVPRGTGVLKLLSKMNLGHQNCSRHARWSVRRLDTDRPAGSRKTTHGNNLIAAVMIRYTESFHYTAQFSSYSLIFLIKVAREIPRSAAARVLFPPWNWSARST